MLTKLTIRNFKRFDEVEIPLSNPVVFVGPNNSGKTSALQALALWELGLRRWQEKRGDTAAPEKRSGVAINRRDLLMVPAPAANLLWRGAHVKKQSQNIRIDVLVDGNTDGTDWSCGLEFDFANDESFYCRPMRLNGTPKPERMVVPRAALGVEVAFLPPMSGLHSNETLLNWGAINVRLGEGRTAEVLRNLCYQLEISDIKGGWDHVVAQMKEMFGVDIDLPEYVQERGEIQMSYVDASGVRLDLSCAGRGLQQTLLLMSYLALHPRSVLLLDEPDAHLEILRQRDIYRVLSESARTSGSQLIIASHSEEILNQAASMSPDSVVAFLGRPHRIPGNRTATVRKSLDAVRYDQYYLAEQTGWVLYVEDQSDHAILKRFAERLNHPSARFLSGAFFVPVGNQPNKGREHFNALLEAKPDLVAYLLVDQDAPDLHARDCLVEKKWQRREIENYICQPETLLSFAREYGQASTAGPLFDAVGAEKAEEAMKSAIVNRVVPAALKDPNDPWWQTVKASDELLDLVFLEFFKLMSQPLTFRKADYHRLVPHIPEEMVSEEVVAVLDAIYQTASRANPCA